MLRVTFIIASLLVLVGIVFFFIGGMIQPAMILVPPVVLGVLLAICGGLAAKKPACRKHVMHAALVIALLGILAMIQPLTIALKAPVKERMLIELVLIMALCFAFLALGVRSFIAIRRQKALAGKVGSDPA